MSDRQASKGGAFGGHIALILFVAAYFTGLLIWFGGLLVRGGTEEHVVMSLVFPVVVLLSLVAVVGLSLIALEGRRAASQPGGQQVIKVEHASESSKEV